MTLGRHQEIKVFNVWCPEKKKRHWAFLEGDILRGLPLGDWRVLSRRWFCGDWVVVCLWNSWFQLVDFNVMKIADTIFACKYPGCTGFHFAFNLNPYLEIRRLCTLFPPMRLRVSTADLKTNH